VEHRHNVWTAVGAGVAALGAADAIALFVLDKSFPKEHFSAQGWFGPTFGLGVVAVVLGLYALLSPVLGVPMPSPRSEPVWRGLRFRWPLTREPHVTDAPPQQVLVSGQPMAASSLPGGMDFRREWSLSQHENQQLKQELQVWGDGRAARKYLKQAYDMLPLLSVDFARTVGGLLYAAYQNPFTDFPVDLNELNDGTATVSVPSVDRAVNLPREQAIMIRRHLRKLIEDAKNDRTRETGLTP
jgi:hypothetical protein